MGQKIEEIARFVAETRGDSIPAGVREHAKLVLLDTLGVILAGSVQPEVEKLCTCLLSTGGEGGSVLTRGFPRSDPRTAALLNGIAGRSVEMCEGHRFVSCQGAVQIVPVVLALGEWLGASGGEALEALILGYETAVRIGLGVTPRRIAHQNGQWPMLGAVAAGARLRGLSAAQTSLAIRIGATLLLTPSYTNVVDGATALNVAGGMSNFAGVLSPELAQAGFEAQADAVEEAFAELTGDGFSPAKITDEMGTRWEIARNYFRLRACCNPIYASLDAAEEALAELHPNPEEIDRIEVQTFRFASVMRNPDPKNYFAAKYSMPHAIAAIIVRGNAGYGSFTEEMVRDSAIAALRRRILVAEDPELNREFPRLKPARVTVRLKDGRSSTRLCESPRGDFLQPYREEEVRGKFCELAGLVLTPKGVADVEALVNRFDSAGKVESLTELLREHSLK